MKIKIEIKTRGKERINADVVNTINEAMENIGYKNTAFKEYRICDSCEVKLPADYPEENELCPNCEDGELQAKRSSSY